ncbi:MAG: iron-sulfur cluster assembly accessory protein [Betaproteobacteria bacterium]
MAITLTESAAKHVRAQLERRGNGLGLRVGVRNVGCSGLSYTYDYADEVRDGDHVFEAFGAKLLVDAKSLAYIDGANFDFVTEGLKQSFRLGNPNVDNTCGCGESFNVKPGAMKEIPA